jgi:hypothetical protein
MDGHSLICSRPVTQAIADSYRALMAHYPAHKFPELNRQWQGRIDQWEAWVRLLA